MVRRMVIIESRKIFFTTWADSSPGFSRVAESVLTTGCTSQLYLVPSFYLQNNLKNDTILKIFLILYISENVPFLLPIPFCIFIFQPAFCHSTYCHFSKLICLHLNTVWIQVKGPTKILTFELLGDR